MTEYDAFGRKVGEDPLAELGWRTGQPAAEQPAPAAPTPSPEPARAATPSPAAPVAAPIFVRRPRRRRGVIAPLLFVAGAVAAGGLFAADAGQELRDALPDTEVEQAPEQPPAGLEAGSLIARSSFAVALARLQTADLGRLTLLRVAPDRIDARLLTRGGRLRNVQIRHDGELRDFGASAGGFGFVDTIGYGRVDRAAPERLTRSAAKRLGVQPGRVDYVVLTTLGWSVVFKGGRQLAADAHGRNLRRIS